MNPIIHGAPPASSIPPFLKLFFFLPYRCAVCCSRNQTEKCVYLIRFSIKLLKNSPANSLTHLLMWQGEGLRGSREQSNYCFHGTIWRTFREPRRVFWKSSHVFWKQLSEILYCFLFHVSVVYSRNHVCALCEHVSGVYPHATYRWHNEILMCETGLYFSHWNVWSSNGSKMMGTNEKTY